MKTVKLILASLCMTVIVAGCNMKEEGREADQHGEMNNRNFGAYNQVRSLGNPDLNFMDMNNNNNNNNNNNTTTNRNGLWVVKEAEDSIQNLDEVKRANVIAADRNAYVGVEMDEDFHGELYPYIEDQIAQQVRNSDATFQNVYISSNRDFVRQMSQYREEIQNGRSAEGLNSGFNKMVRRVFNNHTGVNQD
ncbi:YhcN/YlaJ family sporulation lipoprotein [Neobacillus sp. DY30]|uniref:YhcN/YlaJ family sporulation lipoprotein n=1 Tax=Neobacillus sp. DY30 TaxID=3047871 RepID=UPI0024BFF02A|nr:YhcN/YlaJ family sporulation lipoprotein [Neobacillus sp. DY30]WHY01307.1 YhcN/YlaJ family sporulation lipoprotein [Neobacillus sp. DY30]